MRRFLVGHEQIFSAAHPRANSTLRCRSITGKSFGCPVSTRIEASSPGDDERRRCSRGSSLPLWRCARQSPIQNAWRDFARHALRHRHVEHAFRLVERQALLLASDIARHRDALVAGLEKIIEHLVMPRHYVAAAQDAAVTRRDAFNVEFFKHRVDAAADGVGWRAFQATIGC